jgi:hypothetical protein
VRDEQVSEPVARRGEVVDGALGRDAVRGQRGLDRVEHLVEEDVLSARGD